MNHHILWLIYNKKAVVIVDYIQGDVLWERVTMAFRDRILADPALKADERKLSNMLAQSLRDVYPVVWETYDPNWREFIFAIFALILEEFDQLLPASTVARMESAAREGLRTPPGGVRTDAAEYQRQSLARLYF